MAASSRDKFGKFKKAAGFYYALGIKERAIKAQRDRLGTWCKKFLEANALEFLRYDKEGVGAFKAARVEAMKTLFFMPKLVALLKEKGLTKQCLTVVPNAEEIEKAIGEGLLTIEEVRDCSEVRRSHSFRVDKVAE